MKCGVSHVENRTEQNIVVKTGDNKFMNNRKVQTFLCSALQNITPSSTEIVQCEKKKKISYTKRVLSPFFADDSIKHHNVLRLTSQFHCYAIAIEIYLGIKMEEKYILKSLEILMRLLLLLLLK